MKIRFKRPMDKETRDTIVGGVILFVELVILTVIVHGL